MRYEEIIQESAVEKLYHGIDFPHACQALRDNRMLATSTQRFWHDGKRRREHEPDYRNSYWMKGISLTRDIRYALGWKGVTFVLNGTLLRQKYKIIPFAWNYHFAPSARNINHKREKEEYLILKQTLDDYQIQDYPEDKPRFDVDRFSNPEGELPYLDKYLMGILMSKNKIKDQQPIEYFEDRYPEIFLSDKFLGFV